MISVCHACMCRKLSMSLIKILTSYLSISEILIFVGKMNPNDYSNDGEHYDQNKDTDAHLPPTLVLKIRLCLREELGEAIQEWKTKNGNREVYVVKVY